MTGVQTCALPILIAICNALARNTLKPEGKLARIVRSFTPTLSGTFYTSENGRVYIRYSEAIRYPSMFEHRRRAVGMGLQPFAGGAADEDGTVFVKSIMSKLNVCTRTEAAMVAARRGLVHLS